MISCFTTVVILTILYSSVTVVDGYVSRPSLALNSFKQLVKVNKKFSSGRIQHCNSKSVSAANDTVDRKTIVADSPTNSNRGSDSNQSSGKQRVSLLSPDVIAILSVYFVQGALGLARLATTYYLKDDLHLNPAEAAALTGLTTLPWVIKPLYGFLSDGFPIFGYKRRSYLAIAGMLGSLSWVALSTVASDTTTALACILVGSASVAVSDVVADSIVVEKTRTMSVSSSKRSPETTNSIEEGKSDEYGDTGVAGDLQSLCWGSAAIGGIMSAYFSGSLLETLNPKSVFLITAAFPLLISISSLLIDEKPQIASDKKSFSSSAIDTTKAQIQELWRTLTNPAIYLPVLFIFFWQATPSPDSALFYFSTNELKFQPEFLGRIRLASSVAALLGITAYRTWLKNISIKDIIFWSTIASVPLGLTQVFLTTHYNRIIGIPDQAFALTDTVVLTVLGQIAFMPTLALAASLCPPGVEGTLFASLMSIYNFSGTIGSELGAVLTSFLNVTDTNFDNLTLLVLICSFTSLLPLPFIGLLDKVNRKAGDISE